MCVIFLLVRLAVLVSFSYELFVPLLLGTSLLFIFFSVSPLIRGMQKPPLKCIGRQDFVFLALAALFPCIPMSAVIVHIPLV